LRFPASRTQTFSAPLSKASSSPMWDGINCRNRGSTTPILLQRRHFLRLQYSSCL
jgi:hypothetical protein